jgi:hypothetical protein
LKGLETDVLDVFILAGSNFSSVEGGDGLVPLVGGQDPNDLGAIDILVLPTSHVSIEPYTTISDGSTNIFHGKKAVAQEFGRATCCW